ncbi:MAG: hypothetical protein ACRENX_11355 [Candidatus Dormibacteria bacterium]
MTAPERLAAAGSAREGGTESSTALDRVSAGPVLDPRRCNGPRRQGEPGTCTHPAGWGTSHPGSGRCKLHGGTLRGSVIAGRRELVERKARTILAEHGLIEPIRDPIGRLLELAGEADGLRSAFREMVERLTVDEVVHVDKIGQEHISALVEGYTRQIEVLSKLLIDLSRLGLDEKLVRVEAHKVDLLEQALTQALDGAGVEPAQRQQVLTLLGGLLA